MNKFAQLSQRVKGQDDALKKIRTSIVSGRRFLLHFAGTFGIGKSLSAKLASQAFFSEKARGDKEWGKGTHLVMGSDYDEEKLNETEITAKRDEMKRRTYDQLKNCPKAILVFDELQKFHPSFHKIIGNIVEGAPIDIGTEPSVPTSGASVIMISDFGSAHGSDSSEWRWHTEEEVRKFSSEVLGKRFGQVRVVMFNNLTRSALAEAVRERMENFLCGDESELQLEHLERVYFEDSFIERVEMDCTPEREFGRCIELTLLPYLDVVRERQSGQTDRIISVDWRDDEIHIKAIEMPDHDL